jgi:hypothetical protein
VELNLEDNNVKKVPVHLLKLNKLQMINLRKNPALNIQKSNFQTLIPNTKIRL